MPLEIGGDYKKVNESHYSGRNREVALGSERLDGKRHLAEFEEYMRVQKKKERRDTVELHEEREEEEEKEKCEEESPQQEESPPEEQPTQDEHTSEEKTTPPHLDIII